MIKKCTAALGLLLLFSCGEFPEIKPSDWDSRRDFSGKRYSPLDPDWWDSIDYLSLFDDVAESDVQIVSKNERWKGSGKFSGTADLVYYIFQAPPSTGGVTLRIDWQYRRNETDINFAYKKVEDDAVTVYGYGDSRLNRLGLGADEYFVIKISANATFSVSPGKDWEFGFTVE